jgi:hypothetical protein
VESPESWFEDFGEDSLEGGRSEVALDPDFAAVVLTDSYQVFLTPYGESKGLYVSDRTPQGFVVREQQGGTSDIAFGYRVVARPKDFKAERLATFTPPKVPESPLPTLRGTKPRLAPIPPGNPCGD